MDSQSRGDEIRGAAPHMLAWAWLSVGGLVCLWGGVSPPQALAAGLALALLVGNPHAGLTRITAQQLLQISVVALGFSMDLHAVSRAGLHGFWFAAVSIAVTWVLGYVLGRGLRIRPVTATLVTVGTAICGGSAIAAVGSVVVAGEAEMSAALGTVFLLNAVARVVGHGCVGLGVGVVSQAALFGLLHLYQGSLGFIMAGLFALLYGVAYLVTGRNLWPLVLVHGTWNTVGIVNVYLTPAA